MMEHGVPGPRGSLHDLTPQECWELAASEPVGRLGFWVETHPSILPVNHTVHEHAFYFRTTAESKIARRVAGAAVAFQVDRIFSEDWSGWSVLALGTAHQVEDSDLLVTLWSPDRAHPWAVGERNLWIQIQVQEISGRTVRS